MMNKI